VVLGGVSLAARPEELSMSGYLAARDEKVGGLARHFRPELSSAPRSLSAPSFPIEFAVCSIPCMCRR